METMRQPYDAVMSMPSGRRKRFCEEKTYLERVRANQARRAAAVARARARR